MSRLHRDGQLRMSLDRKTAPRGIYQPSRNRWNALDPNSFGLPSGSSCPGKTSFCTSCYGDRAERAMNGVSELLEYNLELLTTTADAYGVEGMAALLQNMILRYRAHNDRVRMPPEDRIFRIHWDGDFFSTDYAEAWALVIKHNRAVQFWAYTRSFHGDVDVTPILAGLPNLALYLSIDADNAAAGHQALAAHPSLLAAYCAVDYQTARALAPERPLTPVPCPENTGRLALMDDGRGACVTCGICPAARRDILFSTSHREVHTVPVAITRPLTRPGASHLEPYPCAGVGCTEMITPTGARGRRRIYHDRPCQIRTYNARREPAHAH